MDTSNLAIQGSGSDHYFLQTVGTSNFPFIQERGDRRRMHDIFDHLDPADMRQASIILANFLRNAADTDPQPRSPGNGDAAPI